MNILLTNDDGFDAPGLKAIVEALKNEHNLYVCAPDVGMSAMGHAITINRHMRIDEDQIDGIVKGYRIGGTPADCTKLALLSIYKDVSIDLVISGMNNGGNIGTEVVYSGTFAAAHEAHRFNYNAIAVSLVNSKRVPEPDFTPAAEHFAAFIGSIGFGDQVFFYNINYPEDRSEFDLIQTSSADVRYEEKADVEIRAGIKWIALDGDPVDVSLDANTDFKRLKQGFATLVNIKPDWSTYIHDQNTKRLKTL
ncbi:MULTISPECIES: 5'/3'-nucleotidase SurE [unclassified Fusibacter]|uniref:5'/3'-nucleotidase SurE n=1 Tax=unclassified Fusibacter TaxID=2624464 RepID=UPI001012B2EE|nr:MULTISPECIES: 5'/3'-nucleotidase SurE [unclassified Fusibacter]MCK8058817.1 5'/3'-nucleotidase SurE [Fusibacter sp. A2]NPE21891.1 5'/3'-nucleotidase SurE [Fusibacter sp. A1]RXV61463.1 5'/3'-nucleotidase SurE [Fusibacter sp. A1]